MDAAHLSKSNRLRPIFRQSPPPAVRTPSPGLNPGLRPGDGPNEHGGRDLLDFARSDRCQQSIQKSSENAPKKCGNRLCFALSTLEPLERYGCRLTLALCSASLRQSWPRKRGQKIGTDENNRYQTPSLAATASNTRGHPATPLYLSCFNDE